jgi:hypothetical protein
MGATGTPALIGGGGSKSSPQFLGGIHALIVPVSFTMSNSYATGGDTLTLPTSDVRGKELKGVLLMTRQDGTRFYDWDGSATAPKIKAYTAGNTEVGATTNLSAVTLRALLVYAA